MIIIRKLISEINKLFSKADNIDGLINNSIPATTEIIKAIEFYKKDKGENFHHWISLASGLIIDNITRDTTAEMTFVGALSDIDRTKLLGGGDSNKIFKEFGNSNNFITLVKNWLLNAKGQKYSPWINSVDDFNVSNEDYQTYFKYITLCLNGAISPEDWDINWMWNRELNKIPISNKTNLKPTDKSKIISILKQCLENIIPYVDYKN